MFNHRKSQTYERVIKQTLKCPPPASVPAVACLCQYPHPFPLSSSPDFFFEAHIRYHFISFIDIQYSSLKDEDSLKKP